MKNKKISTLWGIIILLVIGGGVYFYIKNNLNPQITNPLDIIQRKDATSTISDSVQTNTQATSSNNSVISDTTTQTTQFLFPSTPVILLRNCHMGECVWEKILSIENIQTDIYGELRKMTVSEVGKSSHSSYEDYPLEYNKNIPIEWYGASQFAVYFLCSKEHPLYIFRDDETGPYTATKLNIVKPYGFEVGSVNEYVLVCHNINQRKDSEMSALGYTHIGDTGYLKSSSIEELYTQFK